MRYIITFYCLILSSALASTAYGQMEFIENRGQWEKDVQYRADFSAGALFLEDKGFTIMLHAPADLNKLSDYMHGHSHDTKEAIPDGPVTLHSFAYKMKLLGASSGTRLQEKPFQTHNNYFIGNDKSKWASDCKIFQSVTYQNVYPGIDIRYYSDADKMKYDFIVHPGGNPGMIAMQYEGPSLAVKDKELIIETPLGLVKELSPYSYYSTGDKSVEIESRFVVRNNVVTFNIRNYDNKSTLIIDPSIVFSSFTGSRADNWAFTATPGPGGIFFAGGVVFSNGYPASPGAFQTVFNGGVGEGQIGGYDIAILAYSPNGSSRLYATYLGGAANEQPHSMICDDQGHLIVAGRTSSDNFPVTRGAIGPGGQSDIFITKFTSDGSALIGSVRIGGSANDGINIRAKYVAPSGADGLRRNYGDDARSEVILDGSDIILASCTQSSNFPVTSGALQTIFGGGRQDGVILKFSPDLSSTIFSTFFGGSGDDACFVASLSPITSALYIAGGTSSSNLPGNKTGVMTPSFQGGIADGFITQIQNDGSSIVRTCYQGTPDVDIIYGLKFDKYGYPYIMGTTKGSWRIQNAAFSNPGGKQFISKLKPDLSSYIYSTVFGTNSADPNISPVAFLVDRCENVYVSGWGGGVNVQHGYSTGNTSGLPEVNPLTGIPGPDGADFYFFVLERNANRQLFGSHFGQNGGFGDHVDGGTSRFDANGVIYQAICANCGGGALFPTTGGVWSPNNASDGQCNQASVKIAMNFAGIGAGVRSEINGIIHKDRGCIPLTVFFQDTLNLGVKFYWSFGDGSPDSITQTTQISHTFNTIGVYIVRLIAEDSSTCNIRDTSYITIHAGDNKANLSFTSLKLPPCASLTMQFTNTSTVTRGSFSPTSFLWDFGDQSSRVVAGLAPPITHTYAAPGNYDVTLYVMDTTFCNSPDSLTKQIRLNPLVTAIFRTSPIGCDPYLAVFENLSLAGTDFIWEFGDGTTSTDVNPTHAYPIGTYQVRLIAIDTSTCNKRDTSAYFTIKVVEGPHALFTWSPPVENTPTVFHNESSPNSTHFLWNFGDGENSTAINPSYQFNESGGHAAELIAYNEANCTDTFRQNVIAIVLPLLDVPNAFTPGKFGINGFISVKGFGIGKIDWRIYNRWGQLVFHTNNRKESWDGTYKGKLQPMDVYVYTLDVVFTDGQKVHRSGDITLIR